MLIIGPSIEQELLTVGCGGWFLIWDRCFLERVPTEAKK